MTPPSPVLAGLRVYCPLDCAWRGRGRSARVLRAYRRHWRRCHG